MVTTTKVVAGFEMGLLAFKKKNPVYDDILFSKCEHCIKVLAASSNMHTESGFLALIIIFMLSNMAS